MRAIGVTILNKAEGYAEPDKITIKSSASPITVVAVAMRVDILIFIKLPREISVKTTVTI